MLINVFEIVGKNAISYESGNILHKKIVPLIKSEPSIVIDFNGVEHIASPFFNGSIGPLLGQMSIDDLKRVLSFENLSEFDRRTLNQVVHNAIEFYSK